MDSINPLLQGKKPIVKEEISASKRKEFNDDLSSIVEKGSFILKELGYDK